MKLPQSRRNHIKQISGAILAPYIASTSWAKSPPSERVRHASFGGMGMAGTDLGQIKSHPNVDLVAVSEIDPNRRRQVQSRLRGAKIYFIRTNVLRSLSYSCSICNTQVA